jgi:hypothetical protein
MNSNPEASPIVVELGSWREVGSTDDIVAQIWLSGSLF